MATQNFKRNLLLILDDDDDDVHKSLTSRLVVSNSLWPHGLYSPWNSPGQNTGIDSLSLLQGIFPTQGSNPGLPHCRRILHQLSHKNLTLVVCFLLPLKREREKCLTLADIFSSIWGLLAFLPVTLSVSPAWVNLQRNKKTKKGMDKHPRVP